MMLIGGLALLSCEVSNPVAPPAPAGGGGTTPGTPGTGASEFNIVIELPPGVQVIVDAQPLRVTITVTTAPGQATSPVGQQFAVTTTLGSLDELNKKEVVGTLDERGIAEVDFIPGNEPGTAQILASVGNTVQSRLIEIEPKPEAPVADFMSQISGLRVLFTDMSTGANLQRRWDFGDGCKFDSDAAATEPCVGCLAGSGAADQCIQTDPVHDYSGAGAFAVKLTVVDDAGNPPSDRTQLIDVGTLPPPDEPPVAMFTTEPQPGGLTVIFRDASAGPPTSWNWDFGDGGTSSAQNPVHTFANAGEFLVSLTVANSAGSNNTAQFVPVGADIPELQAQFTFVVSASGLIVTFTDASTGEPDGYSWNFGDGTTSAEQNPIHEYIVADEYRVALTVSKEGVPSSTAQRLVAAGAPPPTAAFGWTPKPVGDAPNGLQILFEDLSTDSPTAWEWDFGDGCRYVAPGPGICDNDSGGSAANESGSCPECDDTNPVHNYRFSGDYPVTMTVSNTGGMDDSTQLVTADSGEVAPIAKFFAEIVSGRTVDFTDLSTGPPTEWFWDFDDPGSTPNDTSTNQSPIHAFTTDKEDFNVSLTVTNGQGTDTFTQFVRFAALEADFSFVQDGTEGIFTDQSTGDIAQWTWSFFDTGGVELAGSPRVINSAPGDVVFDFLSEGTYRVRLEVQDGGGETDSLTREITLLP